MKYLDLTGLGEVWANIKSYISSKVPTKTSQLQNDSNYATTSQLPSKTSQLTNDSDFTTNAKLATKQDTISDLASIRSGASKGATAVQPSALNNYADLSSEQTISGTKTFTNIITSNKELNYKDAKYDWTDPSLNTWLDAGHVVWLDRTGARRMHELVGSEHGIWHKSCYINENRYFKVNSNRNIDFFGETFKFNNKNIDVIEEQGDFYIRYSNGFQICWGHFLGITNTKKTISYPKSFSDSASISVNGQSGIYVTIDGWTNSAFDVISTTSSISNAWFLWLAVGRWK